MTREIADSYINALRRAIVVYAIAIATLIGAFLRWIR